MAGLEKYCGSVFWNATLTNAADPQFTSCFQQTALVWTPCAFLWFFSIFHFWSAIYSHKKPLNLNNLHIAKLITTTLLFLLMLVDLFYRVYEQNQNNANYPAVEFATPSIIAATMILAFVIQFHARLKGQVTSGVLSLFWFFFLVFMILPFVSYVKTATKEGISDMMGFVVFFIFFALLLLQLILISFAEPTIYDDRACPELLSSTFNQIFFSWFTPLVILGYKKSLEHEDLSRLNDRDKTDRQGPLLKKEWDKEIEKSRISKEKASRKSTGEVYANYGIDEVKFEKSKRKFDLEEKYYKPSLTKAMIKTYGTTMLASAFFKFINDTIQFVSPILLGLLIDFTNDESIYQWLGFVYAVSMYVVAFIQSVVLHQYFHRCFLVGMRIRTGVISVVYNKSLRISNSARQESTVGEIVNLMSTDAQRFMDLMSYINIIWSGPYVIVIAIWQLWGYLGPSVLAGVAVMVLMIPTNGWIASRMRTLSVKNMKLKDKRIKLMNEVLNGIKVLKLYAWEPSFEEQVTKIRNDELKLTKKIAYMRAFMMFMGTIAPFAVTLVSFMCYVLVDENNVLDSQTAFVSLSLFNILRFPLMMFPYVIASMAQAQVSVKRLSKFLLGSEIDPKAVNRNSDTDGVVIKDGTFAWEESSLPILHDIDINIKPGSLVAVVGKVGSGKSSLISSILGEMDKREGEVSIKGSVAYVPQQAWIQNATLKNNILFGKEIRNSRRDDRSGDENVMGYITDAQYNKIIKATALAHDLKILPGGDKTEIGEKGINLSGGQKQRVSLARALCSDSDIYLLDDPLSAVDSHIGKHIFEHVIGEEGILRKKTRILVTHGIQYLPNVDSIIVMKDGRVTEVGSYNELLERKGEFSKFLEEYANVKKEDDEIATDYSSLSEEDLSSIPSTVDDVQDDMSYDSAIDKFVRDSDSLRGSVRSRRSVKYSNSSKKHTTQVMPGKDKKGIEMEEKPKNKDLIDKEEVQEGTISVKVVKAYAKAIGLRFCIIINVSAILYQVSAIGGNSWLSAWANYNDHANFTAGDPEQLWKWLGGYAGFGVAQAITIYCSNYVMATATIAAAAMLHKQLLSNIFKVPSHFFDTTPLGRIVNRFAKDVYIVDEVLPNSVRMWLMCMYSVLGTLIVIIIATPIFAAVIIPLGFLYYFAQRYYVATSRQLKRLESVSRSPIYSHFGETVSGVTMVRAFQHQKRFIDQSEYKVDFNQECYYPNIISNRWLAIRLEIIGNGIVFFAALFAVLARGDISGSLAGLSITYALTITQTLNWWVRQISEIETNIVAVERMKEYSEVPNEADWYSDQHAPSAEWPDKGQVVFGNYGTRYREGLDLVLKNIDCSIESGQKVGIVGRTGAGKSSLTLALFRLIEPAMGTITIDGVDISTIGLHQLRNKLTIIPQDPVLFSGTMRVNLDPFVKYSDEHVWDSLEHAHLKEFVSGLEAKLEYPCSEGGENLSVGQRQLVCLARALLRKTKILILDEATAAVDMQTDDLIQKTIRTEFEDCTVITIAHRLNTIMDYDRVMVLDAGCIAEFGSPTKLLEEEGIFYGMAKDAGLV